MTAISPLRLKKPSTTEQRAKWHEAYLRHREERYDLCACGGRKHRRATRCRSCASLVPGPVQGLAARLWPKVDRSGGPDACWPFIGAHMRNGYGRLGVGRRVEGQIPAHRAAWELTNGPIPEGLYACHTCDNPPCCNPAHLWLGTQGDNLRDMYAKGRRGKKAAA